MQLKQLNLIVLAAIFSAGIATAHSGVQNAAVKARMDAMSGIGAEMKTLGLMAKAESAFDAALARAAAAKIAEQAATTPGLFEADEDDLKSEAKPSIWTNFDDFTAKAVELETVAMGLSSSIASPDDLGAAVEALGAVCKACHGAYRKSKD